MNMGKSLKIAAVTSGIFILLAFCTACNKGASDKVKNTNDTSADAIQTEFVNDNDSVINLSINFATDKLLSQYESFHEYNHVEEAIWIVIRTDTTVSNFEYIKIGTEIVDDEVVFFMDYVEHTVGELTPEKPFMIKTYGHWGTLPHYGVSFTDANNERRFYYIFESGYDGSLSLVEFQNYILFQDTAEALVYPYDESYFNIITNTNRILFEALKKLADEGEIPIYAELIDFNADGTSELFVYINP